MERSSNEPARDSDEVSRLDLSGIRYPSDNLSIELLRHKYPLVFDKGFAERQPAFFLRPEAANNALDVLGGLLGCERLVALSAYCKATGLPCPFQPAFDVTKELAKLYLEIGIARGRNEGSELVREIKRQAAQLANQRHA